VNASLKKPPAHMSNTRLFFITLLLTVAVFLGNSYKNRPAPLGPEPELVKISEGVYLTSQLQTEDISRVSRKGIHTIVAMRPDGEAEDQPSSSEIAAVAARVRAMRFHYIPVPHDTIPETAVIALQQALRESQGSTLLYCRTGRRAVRLFALTEAARYGGPGMDAILDIVKTAGFSADDLQETIKQRIAARYGIQGGSKP
jgi:uncharacterized protein (TIGR01244 family)